MMVVDSWLFLALGAALFYLALHPGKIRDAGHFRLAWIGFVSAMALMLFWAVFQAAATSATLVDVWFRGIGWLLAAASVAFTFLALTPKPRTPTYLSDLDDEDDEDEDEDDSDEAGDARVD